MKIHNQPRMLITGIIMVLATGCVTGTNTFSIMTVPTTRYCSTGETPVRVVDIPASAERLHMMRESEKHDARGDKVSLVP